MRAPRLTFLAVLLLAACESRGVPDLRVTGLTPAQGDDDQAVDLRIEGGPFRPRAFTDFQRPAESSVDEGFAVALVNADSGEAIELTGVRRVSDTELAATVPPGPPRGFYGLRVTDPFGTTAELPEVYRVAHSVRTLAGFRLERLGSQRAGVPFMLQVSAVDAAGEVVDGFVGTVTLQDRSASLTPAQLGPFTLGRARGLVVVGSLIASNAIEARDGEGHAGRSNDFVVAPGLPVQLALSATPPSLDAGACSGRLEVLLQDTAGRAAPSPQAVALALEGSPPDRFALFSDAACSVPASALAFAPNAASATFSFQARRAGTLVLRASAEGLPATTRSLTVSPLAASRLDFASPSQDLAVGACSQAIRVGSYDLHDNPVDPSKALAVELRSLPSGALSFFSDEACTLPLGTLPLGPGVSSATFRVRAASVGTGYVRASAEGLAAGVLALEVSP